MPTRLFLSLSIIYCVVSFSDHLSGADFEVEVAAGKWDRRATPVYLEVDASALEGKKSAVVTGTATAPQPGQIVVEDGRGRIYWIVGELGAWQTQAYAISLHSGPSQETIFHFHGGTLSEETKYTDLLLGERPVLRYMHTPFDPENIELTKKPFHHVFTPDGKRLLTKGAGGLYPHHRGIYFGYNKCKIGESVCDTWHARQGEHQEHQDVIRAISGPVIGGHLVKILWRDRQGTTFIEEERGLHAYRQPHGQLLIEFTSTLRPTRGPVSLGGDRQHAGVQFRATQDVAENQKATRYLRPHSWRHLPAEKQFNTPEHRDLPWNALQFPLGESSYTVAYLSHPDNPDGADFSERLYGRFGEFFPFELTEERTLSVRYRWWVTDSPLVTRLETRGRYNDLADPPVVAVK